MFKLNVYLKVTSRMLRNGTRTRIGGLRAFDKYATGANACIISILSLYSGFSEHITKKAVVPIIAKKMYKCDKKNTTFLIN